MLYFNDHESNVVWYWSAVLAGGVPIPVPQLSEDDATRAGEMNNVTTTLHNPVLLTSEALVQSWKATEPLTVGLVSSEYGVRSVDTLNWISNGTSKGTANETMNETSNGIYNDPPATMLLTSGSTGHSKFVEYTHHQLIESCKAKSSLHKMTSQDVFLSWVSKSTSAQTDSRRYSRARFTNHY